MRRLLLVAQYFLAHSENEKELKQFDSPPTAAAAAGCRARAARLNQGKA
jgi:hypothetical protein